MSDYMIVPGKGKVRKSNNIGQAIFYSSPSHERPQSMYERTRAQVYATGNKWAIENFHATHD